MVTKLILVRVSTNLVLLKFVNEIAYIADFIDKEMLKKQNHLSIKTNHLPNYHCFKKINNTTLINQ